MARLFWAALAVAFVPAAGRAELNLTVLQQGNEVVVSGSGTLDLTGLTQSFKATATGGVNPGTGELSAGPRESVPVDFYTGVTGPSNFGLGGITFASAGSGDRVYVAGAANLLILPEGYKSGDTLTTSSTFALPTFADGSAAVLGVTAGTYTWSWGSPGAGGDRLSITVAAVPEPGAVGLGLSTMATTALVGWRTRRVWAV